MQYLKHNIYSTVSKEIVLSEDIGTLTDIHFLEKNLFIFFFYKIRGYFNYIGSLYLSKD